MKIMVTGGAGFIGSAVVRHIVNNTQHSVLNFDALTYAGNLKSLSSVLPSPRYKFVKGDVRHREQIEDTIFAFQPDIIMHLAAETHVDRSISKPSDFIETNIVGTFTLLEATRAYWTSLPADRQAHFRFHQISTDEVFGSLGVDGTFDETCAYAPNSPYSASKASADHLARAWHQTFGVPIVTSHCTNNYGPYQFPEKLIPLTIGNALKGAELPIYGSGLHVRDWIYVDDHANGLFTVATQGTPGETYSIGAVEEHSNLQVVGQICAILDELYPSKDGSYSRLITHVSDRSGHDARYAIDPSKIMRTLHWRPKETFESGLRKTVQWYLDNQGWCFPSAGLASSFEGTSEQISA